jgi:hypothetical protein
MSDASSDPNNAGDSSAGGVGPEITITNEFTSVTVRKVRTRNGERLEIRSLRVPNTTRLDPLVLESFIWRPFEELAKGLETPFGSGVPRGIGDAE